MKNVIFNLDEKGIEEFLQSSELEQGIEDIANEALRASGLSGYTVEKDRNNTKRVTVNITDQRSGAIEREAQSGNLAHMATRQLS